MIGTQERDSRNLSIINLILNLAQTLVDDKESVAVELRTDAGGLTEIVLRVAPADVGKVIGKQGRTARSMRTIWQAASMKHDVRYSLSIEETISRSVDAP